MNKFININEAISKIKSGTTIMFGGFLGNGSATMIIAELLKTDIKDLTIICNDTAFVNKGVGQLIVNKKVKKIICSHIGTNPSTIEQFNNKEVEIEFVPQGTLAERIRCGGNGLGGFLTPTGLGTIVENGKEIIESEGKKYLLEKPLKADLAIIYADTADENGNLVYKGTCTNFNPLMAMAADTVIVEVKKVVKTGDIAPEMVKTPAIFVDFIVKL
ncbi:MAG: 3-oxoacid CoA-transferase subunit A [Bacteroidales bacterium]|jgi:acetate CoA/acetoacetate CoA-transferase alpha subunit|nr:3-oxoacid CoA-transferase subunit A [Bacteroidales bacterium]